MIDLSLSVKKLVVEHDEFELNERKSMNYGHTFAHAIEKITSFAIPHGFAVTLGLILANRLSNKLDFLPSKEMNKLDEVSKQVLSLYDLNKISSFNFKDIGKVMLTDKKAVNDTVSFVLVSEVGKTFFLKQKIDQRFSKVIHSVVDEVISEILLIDIGASRIKYCSYSKESDVLSKVVSVDFPKSSNLNDHEIILNDVSKIFNEIIFKETKRGNIDYIFICSQMHGFILKDKSDNFISNLFLGRTKDRLSFSSKHSKSFIDLFRDLNKNFQDISGIKPRVGLPVISIFAMENKKMIPEDIKVYNLPEFLIENLAGH